MMALFIYPVKVVLCSMVLYLYYCFFLKGNAFHKYNRFYLVLAFPLSVLLPLVKVTYFTIPLDSKLVKYLELANNIPDVGVGTYNKWLLAVVLLAGLCSFLLLCRFLIGIRRLMRLKRQYPLEQLGDVYLYYTDLPEAPFVFLRNLFWKKHIDLHSPVGQRIFRHEWAHIAQKDSIDKLMAQIICCVYWFNPFFYLIRNELSLIHEYLADEIAIPDKDAKVFAQMLLAHQFSGMVIPGVSPFFNSNLKKRFHMLTQNQKTKFVYAKKLMALPVLALTVFAFMVHSENKAIAQVNQIVVLGLKASADTVRNSRRIIVSRQLQGIPGPIKNIKVADRKNEEASAVAIRAIAQGDSAESIALENLEKIKRDTTGLTAVVLNARESMETKRIELAAVQNEFFKNRRRIQKAQMDALIVLNRQKAQHALLQRQKILYATVRKMQSDSIWVINRQKMASTEVERKMKYVQEYRERLNRERGNLNIIMENFKVRMKILNDRLE